LKSATLSPHLDAIRPLSIQKADDPARRIKISIARQGVARPPEVARASASAHLGRKHSEESRQKMRDSHGRRRGSHRRAWAADEDEIVRRGTPQEAARQTGRSVGAIWNRRRKLRVNPAAPTPTP